jgi:hypothetical protein
VALVQLLISSQYFGFSPVSIIAPQTYTNQGKVWEFRLLLFLGNGKESEKADLCRSACNVVRNWQPVEWSAQVFRFYSLSIKSYGDIKSLSLNYIAILTS